MGCGKVEGSCVSEGLWGGGWENTWMWEALEAARPEEGLVVGL